MSGRSLVNATNGASSCVRHRLAPGRQRLVLLIAAFLVVALLAAACGGSASPGVAKLGSETTTTSASGSPAGSSGAPPSATLQKAQLAYAGCMRKHGVLNFTDPNVGGGYPDGYMKNINASSTQYVIATKDCRPLATAANMAPWTQAQWAAYDIMMLKISTCMRTHGITNFPDPKGGEEGGFGTAAGPIDVGSPQYAAAAKKCNGPPGAPAQRRADLAPEAGSYAPIGVSARESQWRRGTERIRSVRQGRSEPHPA